MAAGKKFKQDRHTLDRLSHSLKQSSMRIKELTQALNNAIRVIKAQEAVIKELRPTVTVEEVKEVHEKLYTDRKPILTVETNTPEIGR